MRVVLAALAIVVVLGGVSTPGDTAPTDDGQAVARRAVAATDALATFHFVVRNERGETELFPGVELEEIEGDIQRPDRFRAVLRGTAFFAPVEVKAIVVGDRFWWTNPIAGRDRFEETSIDAEILALANPNTIVQLIPPLIVDPIVAGRATLDGVPTTLLAGTLDLTRLDEVAPDLPTGAIETERPLPIEVWIDDDDRIRRIRIVGPFVEQDDDDVIRLIDLSAFDAPVDIQPPR